MTNDRHEPGGGPDEERRPRRDRDRDGNPWSDSYNELWGTFIQLGIDIRKPESIEDFNETLEWAKQRRLRQQRWESIKKQIAVGGLISLLTGAAGAAFTWLTSHGKLP